MQKKETPAAKTASTTTSAAKSAATETATKTAMAETAAKTAATEAASKTAAKEIATEKSTASSDSPSTAAEINNTYAGSAVTTTLPDTPVNTDRTVNLSDAKITVSESALTDAQPTAQPTGLSATDTAAHEANDASFAQRAMDASIGLIQVEGVNFQYVGVTPSRDTEPKTPSGYPISNENSNFTPLAMVPFDRSIRVRDPQSGEFFYPAEGATSWEGVSLNGSNLVPAEVDKTASAARLDALKQSRGV